MRILAVIPNQDLCYNSYIKLHVILYSFVQYNVFSYLLSDCFLSHQRNYPFVMKLLNLPYQRF